MNILLIDEGLPHSMFSGKTVRLKNIYERLAKKHRLFFLRTDEKEAAKESPELKEWAEKTFQDMVTLPPLGQARLADKIACALRGRPWYDVLSKYPDQMSGLQDMLYHLLNNYRIDLVITLCMEAAPYGFLAVKRVPWIQDIGDSQILQLQRQEKFCMSLTGRTMIQIRRAREGAYERDSVHQASRTIFVAQDDATIHAKVAEKILVVPNGVDLDYFNPESVQPLKDKDPYVVFTGHMSFLPNQDAAKYFVTDVMARVHRVYPEMKFKIVGADPSPAVAALKKYKGVEVLGRVPDLRHFLAGASAFVCPMRMGSGIKNKLLESMAMNLPIVASTGAVKGFDHLPEKGIWITNDPMRFSKYVCKALYLAKKTSFKNEGMRDFVRNRYSWDLAVEKYENLFQELAGEEETSSVILRPKAEESLA